MLAHHLFLLKSHLFLPAVATLLHAFERVVCIVYERVLPKRPAKLPGS
jgi:hypothetical protein